MVIIFNLLNFGYTPNYFNAFLNSLLSILSKACSKSIKSNSNLIFHNFFKIFFTEFTKMLLFTFHVTHKFSTIISKIQIYCINLKNILFYWNLRVHQILLIQPKSYTFFRSNFFVSLFTLILYLNSFLLSITIFFSIFSFSSVLF